MVFRRAASCAHCVLPVSIGFRGIFLHAIIVQREPGRTQPGTRRFRILTHLSPVFIILHTFSLATVVATGNFRIIV